MSFKTNDIMFLLGAGCSFDAKIPVANKMIEDIEKELLPKDTDWKKFKDLYNYVKSSIIYAEGIFGKFNNPFSIEKFVNVLTELEKKEANIVYPFIANWNNRLLDLAGGNFENIKKLKSLITRQLIEWIKLDNYKEASYYKAFYDFQRELQLPLRIFSLNYDLCFEQIQPLDFDLEMGFDDDKIWNSVRFEENDYVNVGIYLYKLHGSITWKRDIDKGNILTLSEHPVKEPDLIFGTDAKLQSIDPYLFYVYEFRKYSLVSKLIIVIGYSFSDNYINNLLKQALEHEPDRKLIYVSPSEEETPEVIKTKLNLNGCNQLIFKKKTAKEFLTQELKLDQISTYLSKSMDDVF